MVKKNRLSLKDIIVTTSESDKTRLSARKLAIKLGIRNILLEKKTSKPLL